MKTNIEIFKPSKPQGEKYSDVHSVNVNDGILTFSHAADPSMPTKKKITTSVPFIIEEEISSTEL